MTSPTEAAVPAVPTSADRPVWHTLSADQVLGIQAVREPDGLSSAEVASRAERFGPNKFATAAAEPRWRAFLRQYADLMQIVLLVAGGAGEFVVTATGMATEAPSSASSQKAPGPQRERWGWRSWAWLPS